MALQASSEDGSGIDHLKHIYLKEFTITAPNLAVGSDDAELNSANFDVNARAAEEPGFFIVRLFFIREKDRNPFPMLQLRLKRARDGGWIVDEEQSDVPRIPTSADCFGLYLLSDRLVHIGRLALVGKGMEDALSTSGARFRGAIISPQGPSGFKVSWTAAQGEDDENSIVRLKDKASAKLVRFEEGTSFDYTDVDAAIDLLKRCAALLSSDDQGHNCGWITIGEIYSNLAEAYVIRFMRSGASADIDTAIDLGKRAILLTVPGSLGYRYKRFSRFGRLGCYHLAKAKYTTAGVPSFMRSMFFLKKALTHLTEDHADYSLFLFSLAAADRAAFSTTHYKPTIDFAIQMLGNAMRIQRCTPDRAKDPKTLVLIIQELGLAYSDRWGAFFARVDMEECISLLMLASELSGGWPEIWAQALAGLAIALRLRGEAAPQGNNTDLADSLLLAIKAGDTMCQESHFHPSYALVCGLSAAALYDRTGDRSQLEAAIEAMTIAASARWERPLELPIAMSNLSLSLIKLCRHSGLESDVDRALSTQRKALELASNAHPHLPWLLRVLCACLKFRYRFTKLPEDLEEARATLVKAIDACSPSNPMLSDLLNDLADAEYTAKFLSLASPSGSPQIEVSPYLMSTLIQPTPSFSSSRSSSPTVEGCRSPNDVAIDHLRKSALNKHGRVEARMVAARRWTLLSTVAGFDPKSALEAYDATFDLVPLIAGLEQTVRSRHVWLVQMSELPMESASFALRLCKPAKALEWLERGRCMVWGQINSLRTPFEALKERDEELSARFAFVSRALDQAGSRTAPQTTLENDPAGDVHALQREMVSHAKLAKHWQEILESVRAIPGFENFLSPTKPIDLLNGLPEGGPVVIVNVHNDLCHALILLAALDEPVSVPLPRFSSCKAKRLREQLQNHLVTSGVRARGSATTATTESDSRGMRPMTPHARTPTRPISFVLQELWLDVAKPILDALAFNRPPSANHSRPRLWWCLTGSLAFLPIHAAGIYRSGRGTESTSLSDFVVSSYIPTVSSLVSRVKRPGSARRSTKFALVCETEAPGLPSIPYAETEIRRLEEELRRHTDFEILTPIQANLDAEGALEVLGRTDVVHLACHARQDSADPLASGFSIAGTSLALSSIIKIHEEARAYPPELAFLSACHTSSGDEKLSEEAVHLAGGMLAAGYRGVVATMWAIQDEHAPSVALDFYQELIRLTKEENGAPGLNGEYAALALDFAIRKLRKRVGDEEGGLVAWVPYVHFGR